jgi:ATP-dependent protease ClpP protease subunit
MLKVNASLGEIYIYDTIGKDWFGGGIDSKQVIDALNELGGKRALVRINSPGGVADEGIAIFNALKRYHGGVDTVVDALAASAASVIALAGESRLTAPGARWMIHRAMTVSVGNAEDMRKAADVLQAYDDSLVEIYSQYMPEGQDILALMTEETWFTSESAIEAGLSNGTVASVEMPAAMNAAWFKHVPEDLVAAPMAMFKPKIQSASFMQKFYSR